MLRLTLILSAALYALLVIYSETAPAPSPGQRSAEAARVEPRDGTPRLDHLITGAGDTLPVAAVITSSDIRVASGIEVAAFSTRGDGAPVAQAPAPARPMVVVTADMVNLRAGPSTADAVLTALAAGARAELIDRPGDGWALIRAVETGIEGYMADRFLAAAD